MNDKLRAVVELPAITGVDRQKIRQELNAPSNGRILARGLNAQQAEEVRALKIDHLTLRPNYQRHYPAGAMAAHVLGFVNAEGRGQVGIEQALDIRLRGSQGKQVYHADARGDYSALPEVIAEPQAGQRAMLTIIPAIQQALDAAVAESAAFHNPKGIAAIMVRPRTGEIIALSSWPTFDSNEFADAPIAHHYNQKRCDHTGLVYESGSTVKPLIAGAAVAEGHVN